MVGPFKGTLNFYFATGEAARPQCLTDEACDAKGFVVNYDGVYDIHLGDKVKILHPLLATDHPLTVGPEFFSFLHYLSAMWNQGKGTLEIEYEPAKKNKSWGQVSREYQKEQKKRKK